MHKGGGGQRRGSQAESTGLTCLWAGAGARGRLQPAPGVPRVFVLPPPALGTTTTRWGLGARLGQEMMGDWEPKFSPDEGASCGGVPGVRVMGPPKHPVG